MLELIGNSYEEQRTDFFKQKIEKAESRMNYWCKRTDSYSEEWRNMAAYERASDAGWEYSFYNDALEALENHPKWISVEERLPEELGVVLGVMIGTVTLLFYVGDGEFRTGNGMLWEKGCGYITHWMPLPQAPEVEV